MLLCDPNIWNGSLFITCQIHNKDNFVMFISVICSLHTQQQRQEVWDEMKSSTNNIAIP